MLKELYLPRSEVLQGSLNDSLISLENGLWSQIRRGFNNPNRNQETLPNFSDFSGILTPLDELLFWQDLVSSGLTQRLTPKQQQLCQQYYTILSPLKSDLEDLLYCKKKFPDLLELKYGGVREGVQQLGDQNKIREIFTDFQQYLYMEQATG